MSCHGEGRWAAQRHPPGEELRAQASLLWTLTARAVMQSLAPAVQFHAGLGSPRPPGAYEEAAIEADSRPGPAPHSRGAHQPLGARPTVPGLLGSLCRTPRSSQPQGPEQGRGSICVAPSPWAAAASPLLPSSHACSEQAAQHYLLTVDELVVKEKAHPLLALGLRLCDTRQLPRVDEF